MKKIGDILEKLFLWFILILVIAVGISYLLVWIGILFIPFFR
jgi:hypothetical protein